MSARLAEAAVTRAAARIVSVEVPPGIGKTTSMVKQALQLAARGRLVVFALPNHQSLLSAFAFAVKHYHTLVRSLPRRRWPILVYYEGTQRYCPLLNPRKFEAALRYAHKLGILSKELYERLRDLGPSAAMKIYGMNFICKNVCPVYRKEMRFKSRIFVSKTVKEMANLVQLHAHREAGYIQDALRKLGELHKKGVVAELLPDIDRHGQGRGFCIRAVLQRRISKKDDIVFKGALVLTPVQALPFIVATVIRKWRAVTEAGKARLPRPVIIIDEYDSYIYRPYRAMLPTKKQLAYEHELAARVLEEEQRRADANDPDYDPDRFAAAFVAKRLAERLLALCERYENAARGRARGSALDEASSPASLFLECAARPLVRKREVVPPFAPRYVNLRAIADAVTESFSELLEYEEEAEKRGRIYIDTQYVKKKGPWYLLAVWRDIVASERPEGLYIPAIYRYYGTVYVHGYAYGVRGSVLHEVSRYASLGDVVPVYYTVEPFRGLVFNEKERVASKTGQRVYFVVFDATLAQVFSSGAEVVLLSATGFPWLSPDIVTTHSEGVGRAGSGRVAVASEHISRLLLGLRAVSKSPSRDMFEFEIAAPNLPRPISVLMLDVETMRAYRSIMRLYQLRVENSLPPSGARRTDLMRALRPYLAAVINRASDLASVELDEGYVPGIFVLAQRKEVAELLARGIRDSTGARITACRASTCYDATDSLDGVTARDDKLAYLSAALSVGGRRVEVYITWFRSRMTRGVDLPKHVLPLVTIVVGSPYRPPTSFDIVPRARGSLAVIERSSMLELDVYLGSKTEERHVILAHYPIDMSESINELYQSIGRALRRVWSIALDEGYIRYNVAVMVPSYIAGRMSDYKPLYLRVDLIA